MTRLNYAAQHPTNHRRNVRMWLAAAALVALVVAFYTAPPLWRWARLWYWQRQCMNYSAPLNQIVFDDDPKAPVRRAVHCFTELDRLGHLSSGPTDTVIFLHSTTNHDSRCLVMARVAGRSGSEIFIDHWLGSATERFGGEGGDGFFLAPPNANYNHLRVFAGQPDPSNDRHFAFDYELDDKHGTIDCWVTRNEGVLFRVRGRPEGAFW